MYSKASHSLLGQPKGLKMFILLWLIWEQMLFIYISLIDKPVTWVLFRSEATHLANSPISPFASTPMCHQFGWQQGACAGAPVPPGLVHGTGWQWGSPPARTRLSSTACGEWCGCSRLRASAWAQGQRLASSNCSLMCLCFLTDVEKAFLVKMVLLLSTYL